jgi:hypothetical protein
MVKIFSDFRIIALKKDPEPGVFLKAQKPINWKPSDINTIELYSIILDKRTNSIPKKMPFLRLFKIRFITYIHDLIRKLSSILNR